MVRYGSGRAVLAACVLWPYASRDFRDATRTLGDNDEVNDHQDHEHHEARDVRIADHEVTERLDHFTNGAFADVNPQTDGFAVKINATGVALGNAAMMRRVP